MSDVEYHAINDLINEDTLSLMGWYVRKKQAGSFIKLALDGYLDVEDLIQEAALLLIRKPLKNDVAVTTYCCKAVWFATLKMVRERRKAKQAKRIQIQECHHPCVYAAMGDEYLRSLEEKCENALMALSERKRRIVQEHLGFDCEPRSLRDIGNSLGVSAQRAGQIEQVALSEIKKLWGIELVFDQSAS